MMNPRTLAVGAFALLLSAQSLEGQGRAQYRDFQLGGNLASVATLAGIAPSEAKMIHQRPALMQDLEWRPAHWMSQSITVQTDPVQQVTFSFYNDQLFRVVVDYDRQRTDGLTAGDMIEAISQAYGPPLTLVVKRTSTAAAAFEAESGTAISRWEGADYAVALLRSSYATTFKMIVTMPRLDALARTADTQSLRLDAREAPQREIARQKKEVDDARTSQEKARVTNKATFRP
ncbi:MAG: hypothetical protein AUJ01_12060 [Acidobacteria bacterium 13_1_40CM_3_65_5]|nr:MAG: hypothetical protein AUJ01_12060 [Acidobacteria bacterium 13_1_40CM_3_65_5]